MNISPRDILEKEFSKKLNGYDPEQVDGFLDDIIKQFESLMEENEDVIAKNESMKNEIVRLKQKADKMDGVEDKMMQTVLAAQRNASMYIDKAEAQAQRILDTANQNAKTVIESTYLRMEAAQKELKKYETIIADYKRQFKLFLEEQAAHADARLDDREEMEANAADISKSINSLTQQMRELDDPQFTENASALPADTQGMSAQGVSQSNMQADAPQVQAWGDVSQAKTRVDMPQPQAYAPQGDPHYDYRQSTAQLQEVVNDVIRD